MKKTNYKLRFLPIFEDDLNDAVDYLSITLNNSMAAHNLVDDIEKAILKRLENPLIFAPFNSSKYRRYPYYRINVRNFPYFM